MASTLLLLGASVRAAAYSARRANLIPWGADLFLDADLQHAGQTFQRVTDYSEFLAISEKGPPGPWMYTGALENRPGLVDKISQKRPLWGNSGDNLRKVRSPHTVFKILSEADIPCPKVGPARRAGPIRWLQKPKAGAGGKGITWWSGKRSSRRYYLQEYIEGDPCAAVFVANQGRSSLLGVTHQLIGQPWLHAGPFQYCGSIGPLALNPSLEQSFLRLGNTLAAAFHLKGLFGVDCLVRDNIPWPVEVNPRYTASVEVLELASRAPALLEHARVFDPSFPACVSRPEDHAKIGHSIGKAILFARAPLIFPKEGPWSQALTQPMDFWAIPVFADIPARDQVIAAHHPILTFFTRADSTEKCLQQLQRIAADLDRLLFPS
jgi:predicted ATP-grasp superfamily ATP-dependent carboligase